MLRALRALCAELAAVLVRVAAYAAALAGLATAAWELIDPVALIADSRPPERPEWREIDRLTPAFELTLDDTGAAKPVYTVLRHAEGGGRKDVFAARSSAGSLLRIEIYRPGSEIERFADPDSTIAAGAGALHSDGRPKPAPDLETKFGMFHLVEFQRRGESAGRCAAFVRSFGDPRLQISGFACNPGDVLIDRAKIACALDRLTLLAAGGDAGIGALFAQAEVNRNFCGQQAPALARSARRSEEFPPRLRGRLAAR